MTSAEAHGSCYCAVDFLFTCFAFFVFYKNSWRTKKNKKKNKIAHPREEHQQRAGPRILFLVFFVFWFLVFFQKLLEKQKTKNSKKQDCTRQWRGVVADSRVLSCFCYFGVSWSCSCLFFFGLWSHSRKAKENLVVRTPRVSPSEQNRGRSALFTAL